VGERGVAGTGTCNRKAESQIRGLRNLIKETRRAKRGKRSKAQIKSSRGCRYKLPSSTFIIKIKSKKNSTAGWEAGGAASESQRCAGGGRIERGSPLGAKKANKEKKTFMQLESK